MADETFMEHLRAELGTDDDLPIERPAQPPRDVDLADSLPADE